MIDSRLRFQFWWAQWDRLSQMSRLQMNTEGTKAEHRFSSTCGSTGTWKYLQVLSILNRIKLVNCKHQYVEQNTFKTLCHTVTEPNMARSRTFYHQSALFLSLPLPSHIKNIVSYSYTYPKLIKCSYLGWYCILKGESIHYLCTNIYLIQTQTRGLGAQKNPIKA